MFDTEDIMRQFDPSWSRATGSPSVTLAFSFETPDEVDAKHDELVAAGGGRAPRALGRLLGHALRRPPGSGR